MGAYDEALSIRRDLVAAGRADLREDVATALENQHILVEGQGDLPEALELIDEAAGIWRTLVREGFRYLLPRLIRALDWQAITLDRMHRPEAAARCRQEAREWEQSANDANGQC